MKMLRDILSQAGGLWKTPIRRRTTGKQVAVPLCVALDAARALTDLSCTLAPEEAARVLDLAGEVYAAVNQTTPTARPLQLTPHEIAQWLAEDAATNLERRTNLIRAFKYIAENLPAEGELL